MTTSRCHPSPATSTGTSAAANPLTAVPRKLAVNRNSGNTSATSRNRGRPSRSPTLATANGTTPIPIPSTAMQTIEARLLLEKIRTAGKSGRLNSAVSCARGKVPRS
jgi:hypothetical protein